MIELSSKNNMHEINPDNFELSELTTYQVGVYQAAAARAIQKHKDEYLKPHGLSGAQWLVIGTVLDSGNKGCRITDLANSLDVTMAFLTNTVNLLESKGVLERVKNLNDSRSRIIRVTKKYKPICVKIENDLRAKFRKSLYSKITAQELRTFVKVLYKFSELE